ncbi:gonadotropin-releasing hormone II receptor-like isoform X2 [Cottoperca gobio]|uniref:Type II GnRH receptor n=1 Tax=Cottoperca gobio TaxID=56716 RepID=A0A6J2P9Z9_COTGO|nr:gonadotropin-releasing hormone II receptor-like isoform X2 [Cottoperca gobio]
MRPHSLRPPVGQLVRSPGRASNQQPDDQQATGRQEAAEHCGSTLAGATEGPGYMSTEPAIHSLSEAAAVDRKLILITPGSVLTGFCLSEPVLQGCLWIPEHEESQGVGPEELLIRMSGNWSSPPPPNSSQFPPVTDWEAPSFTRAAQFRVGATFVLFLFAACSNLALLASVWRGRGRRLASHLRPLMLSLASADLMMTFVVMPLDAVWNVTVQWYGGDTLCKLLSFLKLFAMHASAFILVVISLDRQHAILHPLDALSAHCRNRRMLLLAWSLSLLLASPQLFLFRAVIAEAVDFTQCASHGSFRRRWHETLYNMFHFTTLYVVPLMVMSCCYSRILLHIHLQHRRDKGESYLRRSGTDIIPKARMKTLKMTVVIVLSFVVCWTPYYLLGIWYWFQPNMLHVTPEYVHHGLFVFGNLNTCCDPVIYGFYTPSFRADLAACCRRTKSDTSLRSPDRQSARGGAQSGEHEADPATNSRAGD